MDTSGINYHYFEDLKIGNPIQKSKQKYELLRLDDIITGKDCLDIGCNTGYNTFKMAKTANYVIGVDSSLNVIDTAIELNNEYFHLKNINFVRCDIFNYFNYNVDIILCTSTFHYFVDRQQEFINNCHARLNDNGILILEAGILTDIEPKRKDCEYPTKKKLLEYCKEFELIYEGDSVLQSGDNIQRYVFHFKKK